VRRADVPPTGTSHAPVRGMTQPALYVINTPPEMTAAWERWKWIRLALMLTIALAMLSLSLAV